MRPRWRPPLHCPPEGSKEAPTSSSRTPKCRSRLYLGQLQSAFHPIGGSAGATACSDSTTGVYRPWQALYVTGPERMDVAYPPGPIEALDAFAEVLADAEAGV